MTNGFEVGAACVDGDGICARNGQLVCSLRTGTAVCDAQAGPPDEAGEIPCNGLDDDCDGTIDGLREVCNGIDDDCDSLVDEGLDDPDTDEDGWLDCDGADCDDDDPNRHPGVIDVAGDALDADCDGQDNDTPVCHSTLWTAEGGAVEEHFGASLARLQGPQGIEILIGAPGRPGASIHLANGDLRTDVAMQVASAGHAVANVGDTDGDGFDDFSIGAPMSGDSESGHVRTFHNRPFPSLHWSLDGIVAGQRLGWSLANLGDVDGDDSLDMAIGAPGGGLDQQGVPQQSSQIRFVRTAEALVTGTLPGVMHAGFSVLGPGDMTGDGRDDLAVGIPTPGTGGRVRMYFWTAVAGWQQLGGGATGVNTDRAGMSLAAPGDINSDGLADVLWGGQSNDRAIAKLVVRPGNQWSEVHRFETFGRGFHVSIPGDVTGDGVRDYVLGRNSDGAVMLFSGRTLALVHTIAAAFPPNTPVALDGGDLDGDGRADTVVGAPAAEVDDLDGSGRVRAFRFHLCD